MAQVTQPQPPPDAAPFAAGPTEYPRPGLLDVVRSEWTKVRTLRATFWSFLAAAVVVVGLGALITLAAASQHNNNSNGPDDFFNIITVSWYFGQFAFLVLGVMTVSSEYSTGLVTNTYLATPVRPRVLIAKIASFTVIALVIAEIVSFINFFTGHAILSAGNFLPNLGISGHNVLRAVIGTGVEATLVGLMGLGLGSVLRHTAGGIMVGIVVLLVVPIVASFLPNSVQHPLIEYWPTEAGAQLTQLHNSAYRLTAGWGLGVMTLFVVVLLLLGAWTMKTRDA